MKSISDYSGFFEADADFLNKTIEAWEPLDAKSNETAQEESLFQWLKLEMPDVPMTRQYATYRGRGDIVIQDRHLIELKLALSESEINEFDRCIGQLTRYFRKWVINPGTYIYVVLVGESDVELRSQLKLSLKEWNDRSDRRVFRLIEMKPPQKSPNP